MWTTTLLRELFEKTNMRLFCGTRFWQLPPPTATLPTSPFTWPSNPSAAQTDIETSNRFVRGSGPEIYGNLVESEIQSLLEEVHALGRAENLAIVHIPNGSNVASRQTVSRAEASEQEATESWLKRIVVLCTAEQ